MLTAPSRHASATARATACARVQRFHGSASPRRRSTYAGASQAGAASAVSSAAAREARHRTAATASAEPRAASSAAATACATQIAASASVRRRGWPRVRSVRMRPHRLRAARPLRARRWAASRRRRIDSRRWRPHSAGLLARASLDGVAPTAAPSSAPMIAITRAGASTARARAIRGHSLTESAPRITPTSSSRSSARCAALAAVLSLAHVEGWPLALRRVSAVANRAPIRARRVRGGMLSQVL